jgi:hypothetical protein
MICAESDESADDPHTDDQCHFETQGMTHDRSDESEDVAGNDLL